MNMKEYAMRTFGLEIKELGLDDEERDLLEQIRIWQDTPVKRVQNYPEEIDLDFARECLSHGWN